MQKAYVAIIDKSASGYGVFFPDLPGCTSAGRTVGEAAANATQALQLHLASMAEDGDAVPEPRGLGDISRDRQVKEVARVLVTASVPGTIARVNITVDEAALAIIDEAAERAGLTRSAYLVSSAMKMGNFGKFRAQRRASKRLRSTKLHGVAERRKRYKHKS